MLGGDQQIQVRLITDDDTIQLQQKVFSLPVNANNSQLQRLVQNLLDSEQEFVFQVGDEILQNTIGKYCHSADLSGEHILDVHYAIKRLFEDTRQDIACSDWVAGVSITHDFIFAGLYDGKLVKISKEKSEKIYEKQIHDRPIKSVCFVNNVDGSELLATSSLDQNLALVRCHGSEMSTLYVLKGHTETVTCCGVSPSRQQLASGGWDKLLKVSFSSFTFLPENCCIY